MKKMRTSMNQTIERSPGIRLMSMILRGLDAWRGRSSNRQRADGLPPGLPVDERVERFRHVADGYDLARVGGIFRRAITVGDDAAGKSHLRRFAHAQRRLI